MALVHILNKQSSRSDRVGSFPRPLILVTLHHNIQFKAQHIPGIDNKIADATSRKQWKFFRRIAPSANKDPQHSPRSISVIIIADEEERLLTASLSVNTHNTYKTGFQAFEKFRKSQGLILSWPPLDVHLTLFIARLLLKGFKHATA